MDLSKTFESELESLYWNMKLPRLKDDEPLSQIQLYILSQLSVREVYIIIPWSRVMVYAYNFKNHFQHNPEDLKYFLIVVQKVIAINKNIPQNEACELLSIIYELTQSDINKLSLPYFLNDQIGFRQFYQINDEELIKTFKRVCSIEKGGFFKSIHNMLVLKDKNLSFPKYYYAELRDLMCEQFSVVLADSQKLKQLKCDITAFFKVLINDGHKYQFLWTFREAFDNSYFMNDFIMFCSLTQQLYLMKSWIKSESQKEQPSKSIYSVIFHYIQTQCYALQKLQLDDILQMFPNVSERCAHKYFYIPSDLGGSYSQHHTQLIKQVTQKAKKFFFTSKSALTIFHILASYYSWKGTDLVQVLDQGGYFDILQSRYRQDQAIIVQASNFLYSKCQQYWSIIQQLPWLQH